MTTLYSLPSCGICHMIKTKLEQKQIPFEEKSFSEIAEKLKIDHAPVLMVELSDIEKVYIYSPVEMVAWINQQ